MEGVRVCIGVGRVRAVSSVSEEVIGGSDAGRQCWGGKREGGVGRRTPERDKHL